MPDVTEINSSEITPQNNLLFKLPDFEGPLDLLLHLIKENKIDIYDIPILLITKQYLDYLDLMKELNLEIAGEFLVMAATLIHIKSKTLLPPSEEQAEEQIEDPRAELVKRLLEYQAFKDASVSFREKEDIWKNIFRRPLPQNDNLEQESEPLLFEANIFDLISAFKDLLSKTSKEIIEISRETLTVADKINFIMEKLDTDEGIKFEDLFKEDYSKIVLIVTFLALLELIRLGLVKAYQDKMFGSIWVINPQRMEASENADGMKLESLEDVTS
jgi:segregation and condensation protein A